MKKITEKQKNEFNYEMLNFLNKRIERLERQERKIVNIQLSEEQEQRIYDFCIGYLGGRKWKMK